MSDLDDKAVRNGWTHPEGLERESRIRAKARQRAAVQMFSIKVGQIWREVDRRCERYIRIEGDNAPAYYTIRTVVFDGTIWIDAPNSRACRAQPFRFNGKSDGYDLYTEAP